MKFVLIGTPLFAACLLGAGPAFAESVEYYYGFNDVAPMRSEDGLALFIEDPSATAPNESQPDVADEGAVDIFWNRSLLNLASPDYFELGPDSESSDRIELGFGWSPDLGAGRNADPMANVRSMAGGEPDRIGVRADLTAMLFDGSDPSQTTAWRVTGMLGSTSVSLAPEMPSRFDDEFDTGGGMLWDVGVGWSSGSFSLNAEFLSAYREVDGLEADMAVLTFGAGYMVLPGLSLYGELNLVDESEEFSVDNLGTVVIIGTGVNF